MTEQELQRRMDAIEWRLELINKELGEISGALREIQKDGCLVGRSRYEGVAEKLKDLRDKGLIVSNKQDSLSRTIYTWSGGLAVAALLLTLVIGLLKVFYG